MPRTGMFVLFFTILFTSFALFQAYVFLTYRKWVGISYEGNRRRLWLRAGWFFFIGGNLAVLTSFLVRQSEYYSDPFIQLGVLYPAGIFTAIIILASLILVLKDVIRLPATLPRLARIVAAKFRGATAVPQPVAIDKSRREFLRRSGILTISATTATPVFASLATARDYQINRIDIVSPKIPGALAGLRIAHLSDIHSGIYMTEKDMAEIFALTNELKPDLILMTGDLVDNNESQIPPLHATIRHLKADIGVYGAFGNHDHFADIGKVKAALDQTPVTMLVNSNVARVINGAPLTIAGIDDFGRGKRNFAHPELAAHGIDPETFSIFLSHRPEGFDFAKRYGFDLTLAGHTHGGQVGFDLPGIKLNPVHLFYKHPMGHFIEEGKQLYVNVGVGMVGAPIRLVKPEIAVFTLRPS